MTYATRETGRENMIWAVILRHGLADGRCRTQREIAQMLELSEQMVHQYLRGLNSFKTLCEISLAIASLLLDRKLDANIAEVEKLENRRVLLSHILAMAETAETDQDVRLIDVLTEQADALREGL